MPVKLRLEFSSQTALEDFLDRHPNIEDGIVACTPAGSGQPPPDPGTTPPNLPPIAVLQVTGGVTDQDTWAFSTVGSNDPEGQVAESRVNWGDGSPDSVYTGSLPPLELLHNFPSNGSFTIRLTITDAGGLAQTATVSITVIVAPGPPDPDPDPVPENLSPVAALAVIDGQFSGEPFTFSTAGSFDPDNNAASWSLNYGDGTTPASGSGLPTPTLQHTYALAGTYTVGLAITDTGGKVGTATLTLIVQAPPPPPVNQPPTAGISRLSGLYVGESFLFSLTGGDTDGSLTNRVFDPGDGSAPVTIGTLPTTVQHIYTQAGSYQAKFTTTDNGVPPLSTTATTSVVVSTVPTPGAYPYFNAQSAMGDCILSRSLRSQDQLITNSGQSAAPYVVYDAVMDAAKIIIVPFGPSPATTLAAGIDAVTETLTFSPSIVVANQRPYKIDNEIVIADRVSSGVFRFIRGQGGTSAAAHSAGASVYAGASSLIRQVRIPVNLIPGFTYLLGWEAYHTPEIQQTAWKCWQHSLGPSTTIWCEVNNSKNELSGGLGIRAYRPGPNQTDQNPLSPRVGAFTITTNRWFRVWTFFDMRPAIPLVSLWAGDAVTGVVQLISGVQEEYLANSNSIIDKWWIEYNTSVNDLVINADRLGWNRNLFIRRGLEEAQAAASLSVAGLVA